MRISDWSSDVCSSDLPKLDYMPILGRKVVPQISSSNLGAQLNATLAGAGICILPDFLAGEHSGLQPVLRKAFSLTRTFWIVAHEDIAALRRIRERSEEHTSELQSLMRISYAVFCLKKNT